MEKAVKKGAADIELAKAEIMEKTMKLKQAEEAHTAFVARRKSESLAIEKMQVTFEEESDDDILSQINDAEAIAAAKDTASTVVEEHM